MVNKWIFIVWGINLLLWIGMPISYFIILSDAVTPILESHLSYEASNPTLRTIVVITIGSLLAVFCLKRELHELRSISIISILWAWMFCIQLALFWSSKYNENNKPISRFLHHQNIISYFKTAPNFLLAYWFQPSFFTVYKSLEKQNDKNAWRITKLSFILSTIIYLIVAFLSLELYGDGIKSDLLLNITKNENTKFKYLASALFLVIAALHLPLIFFIGKESLLMIYWEFRYHTLSEDKYLTRENSLGEDYNFAWSNKKNVNISSTLDWKEYYPITLCLYTIVIILSIYIQDLGKIFSFVGSFWATLIGYILPSVFFLKLQDGNALIHTNVFAFLVLMFGITFLVCGLYSNILL